MNSDVDEKLAEQAARAIAKARALRENATELESDRIVALAAQLARPVHDDSKIVNEAYAGFMRSLWVKYPKNDEVGFLYTDALVNEAPWELWAWRAHRR